MPFSIRRISAAIQFTGRPIPLNRPWRITKSPSATIRPGSYFEALEVGSPDGRLWVIGVDDPHYYGCDDLAAALDGVPDEAFKLLLAHTPEVFEEAARAGIDLYLSGHTHAGQICVPWLGPLVLNATCPRSYTYGHWHHGEMQGYTTRRCGVLLAPRTI
jgi:predicted MPP superfamily phosphohydrolase